MEKIETNEKAYYNAKLDRMLTKYITREQYGQFSIILKEIFLRRAYEFDFSEVQMENEVANFVQNARSISFVTKEEMPSLTSMGVYCPSEFEIRINQDYYLSFINEPEETFGSELFETLTHEVYHAITDTENELGLVYLNNNGEWVGTALNEAFTETAADRASQPRGAREAAQYRSDTDGYPDITFFTNLLAASIGVTEKEILQGGAQHRAQLMQVIASKFPEGRPYERAQRMFQRMEATLDTVYNAMYSKEQLQTDIEKDAKEQILRGALSSMYSIAFELASHQIECDTGEINSETLGDISYRYSKMDKIMQDSIALFERSGKISPEYARDIYSNVGYFKKRMADRIIGIDTILKQGRMITDYRDYNYAVKYAKQGLLPNNSKVFVQKYGIKIAEVTPASVDSITDDLEHNAFVMREDFDNGRQWNNRDVSIVMKRIFIEDMERKGVFGLDKTDELPMVDPDKTEEIPVVDPDKTEELPVVDGDEKKKGIFERFRDSVNIIITRFKNRNQQKLLQGQESREDNSEYYASLATQTLESSLDKYIVKIQPILKAENIQVESEAKQTDKIQEDEER